MAYIINKFDGSQLVVVDDGILDSTSAPLGLVGRNYTGWGEVFNENFVFLLENFANTAPPSKPLVGQLWYDATVKVLKSFDGETWNSIGNSSVGDSEPGHAQGRLWLKSSTNQLYVSDGTNWKLIGPEAVEGFGATKLTSISVLSNTGTRHPIIISEINGVVTGLYSDQEFTLGTEETLSGFSTIYPGINLPINSDTTLSTFDILILTGAGDNRFNLTLYYRGSEGTSEIWSSSASGDKLAGPITLVKNSQEQKYFLREVASNYSYITTTFPENPQSIGLGDWYDPTPLGDLQGQLGYAVFPPPFIIASTATIPTAGGSSKYNFVGSLKGNADSASSLATARTINNVPFDGKNNIVVRSSTTNILKSGNYIVGNDFDGTNEEEWSVDATSQNRIGKVVARDANGDFAAGTITADLVGNLSAGNITSAAGTSTFDNVIANNFSGELTGNSSTATKLKIARTINTIPFDGTANITLPVPAETLIGTDLAPNVVNSSLRTLGRLTSLRIEEPGVLIGGSDDLRIFLQGSTPTIRSQTGNILRLELESGSVGTSTTDMTFVSAIAVTSKDSITGPAFVGDWNKTVNDEEKINLGVPSHRFNNVYSNKLNATDLTIKNILTQGGPIIFPGSIRVDQSIEGNLVGNVVGNLTGNVTGSLTGAASLNLLKAGDTMTGDITWTQSSTGLNWSAFTDSASIKFYTLSDFDNETRLEFNTSNNGTEYFLFSHTYEDGNKENLMKLQPNDGFGNIKMTVYGNQDVNGTLTATNFVGNGSQLTNINAVNLQGTIPAGSLKGIYNIDISGSANRAVSAGTATNLSGGTIQSTGANFSGNISIDKLNPEIRFNHRGDSGVELAISVQGENFVVYEPEDSNREWLRMNDNDASLYVYGDKVLDSGNYTSYTVTKTGTGASGIWPISISGNAATVSSITSAQVRAALGFTPADPSAILKGGGSASFANMTLTGKLTVAPLQTGGIHWPNNPFGAAGDTASITLLNPGGQDMRMTFRLTNNSGDQFEFYAPNNDGIKYNGHVMIHANNIGNYAGLLESIISEPPLWAGVSTEPNIISTYRNFPIGTKVAYWEERRTTVYGGNGSATLTDRYYRVIRKISSTSWTTVGG
jgi:hypothetical protein